MCNPQEKERTIEQIITQWEKPGVMPHESYMTEYICRHVYELLGEDFGHFEDEGYDVPDVYGLINSIVGHIGVLVLSELLTRHITKGAIV